MWIREDGTKGNAVVQLASQVHPWSHKDHTLSWCDASLAKKPRCSEPGVRPANAGCVKYLEERVLGTMSHCISNPNGTGELPMNCLILWIFAL